MPRKLSQPAFASEVGLSKGRISQLVAEGLPVEPGGGIDPEKGKAWIADHLDPARRAAAGIEVPKGKMGSAAAIRMQKDLRQARLLDLELKRREGKLVDREEVEKAIFERARFERDAWIGWASRIATEIAAELDADPRKLFEALDLRVREQLTELSQYRLLHHTERDHRDDK